MNIHVGNLPYDLSEETLRAIFSEFGEVSRVAIITDKDSGRPKGFAFVEMPRHSEAMNAIKALHESSVKGRNIIVSRRRAKNPWSRM
ncbi:MAG: RNA recognition motif domain-containing protein [Acidiferrobacterales bacterium]